jgi:dephospho-CoA kinase
MGDEFWYIRADEEERIGRLMAQRGYTREKSESVLKSQMSDAEFSEKCNRIIENHDNADFDLIRKQIVEIIDEIFA